MIRLEQGLTALKARGIVPQNLRTIGQDYGALIALVVLILFDLIFTRQFNSVIAITDLLVHVTPTLILGVGMTLVIATGGIDISVGSIMGLTGILTYLIFSGKLLGIHNIVLGTAVAIPIALVVATLIGVINGVLVTRFNVQPIVATLISLITVRGIAEVTVNGFQFAFLSAPIVSWLSGNVLGFLPRQVILMAVIVAFFAWLMRATAFSRYLLAAGGNQSAARLAGVPVNKVLIIVYTISGLLAGIAGLAFIAFDSAANPVTDGLGKELDAIAAVAVGGTPLTGGRATVLGTAIGAIFIQLIRQTVVSLNIPDDIASVIIGLLIVLAVFLQHQRKAD
ncbi:sugar ABC transporter permease [Reticulibacter mediterranei]|uniref:Sugar ABC transporter permease n=1 Tax=Reticulibacter mediterranei TaxID=2778369 RepID=A0A8J3N3I3_9CHLR|nr:ABC transporter permease [Reticulibacter mediterranei]GHO97164.1 sugar ABC transporter permease [Reticulibacter mediterranei]